MTCGADERIHLDLDFLVQLQQEFGATGRYAQAYILAHEFGHHLQKLLGTEQQAQDAASAVGDDRIQQKMQGRVNPESWTHGSAAEREYGYLTGYQAGLMSACDTFSA